MDNDDLFRALTDGVADDPLWQVVIGDGFSLIGYPGAPHREVMRQHAGAHKLWLNLGYRAGDGAFDSDRLRAQAWSAQTLVYQPPGSDFVHTCTQTAPMLQVLVSDAAVRRLIGEDWSDGGLGEARPVDGSRLAATHDALHECLYGTGRLDALALESVVAEFVGDAATLLRDGADHVPAADRNGALDADRLARATDFIAAHADRRLSLEDMAAEVGLSPFRFAKGFRAATGLPPHRHLLGLRVARARVLLAASRRPISDIALEAGFASQSHLTDVFRRQLGVTPRRYRAAVARRVTPASAAPRTRARSGAARADA